MKTSPNTLPRNFIKALLETLPALALSLKNRSKFVKVFMKAEQLREKLHEYIDKLDEARLDEIYKIIEGEDICLAIFRIGYKNVLSAPFILP